MKCMGPVTFDYDNRRIGLEAPAYNTACAHGEPTIPIEAFSYLCCMYVKH